MKKNTKTPQMANKIPTLSLCMIVKNREKELLETLTDIKQFVDEIIIVDNGSTDKTIDIAKKFGAKVYEILPTKNPEYFIVDEEFGIQPNFTKLRNESFKYATCDYILWLDDDKVQGKETIKPWLMHMAKAGITELVATYIYGQIDGIDTQPHPKSRIVKNGLYRWEFDDDWAVHENLYIKDEYKALHNALATGDIVVIHQAKESKDTSHAKRNYAILRQMAKLEKFQNDPRIYFLIAREAMSIGRVDEAVKNFEKYLQMEYTRHDAVISCMYLAHIWKVFGFYQELVRYGMKAIEIYPAHPAGYILAADGNILMGKIEEAEIMLEESLSKRTNPLDPMINYDYELGITAIKIKAKIFAARKEYKQAANLCQGKLDEGQLKKADKEELEELHKKYHELAQADLIEKSFRILMNNKIMENKGKIKKKEIETIAKLFPEDIKFSKDYIAAQVEAGNYRAHGAKEVSFICYGNFEKWDSKTMKQKGTGGSETAVAELSKVWAKEGWKVTVWANPEKEGIIDGVEWRNVGDVNYADMFNILIIWRAPTIIEKFNLRAKKKYLYLQDIMNPDDFPQASIDKWDKVILLSKYHKSTCMHLPTSKVYFTTNGINIGLIDEAKEEFLREGGERNYHKALYTSSADRGLEPLARMLIGMKKKNKQLHSKLDVTWFYGWNSYFGFKKNKKMDKFQRLIMRLIEKAGIKFGGRIGKKELYKQYLSAQYHLYPLIGPAETSCISVMESQALGAIPVTTGITALEETQQYGLKVPLDKYPFTLDYIYTHEEEIQNKEFTEEMRAEMMEWAYKTYDWDKIAKQWIKDLF